MANRIKYGFAKSTLSFYKKKWSSFCTRFICFMQDQEVNHEHFLSLIQVKYFIRYISVLNAFKSWVRSHHNCLMLITVKRDVKYVTYHRFLTVMCDYCRCKNMTADCLHAYCGHFAHHKNSMAVTRLIWGLSSSSTMYRMSIEKHACLVKKMKTHAHPHKTTQFCIHAVWKAMVLQILLSVS